jgi:diguanylate cyclase (GGDEF)-like protein
LVKVGACVYKFVESQLDTELTENLHKSGVTDALTGVFNKRYVLESLEKALSVAKAGMLGLVILDLDHFKKVNDTYGHVAGDYVLKETCRILKEKVIRADEILGRFGGEEFVVILPDSTLETSVKVAERIRETIEKHSYSYSGTRIPVTASLGVVTWNSSFTSTDLFLEAADQLLYKSKQGGRNRVTSPQSQSR